MEQGVEIRLLSSFRLTEGTAVRMPDDTRRPLLAGVTRRLADGTVTLVGRGADGGVLDTLLSRLAEEGIRPLNASYGDGAVTVWVEPSELLAALRTAHSLL